MGHLEKLDNINIPIALLLLQLVTYPFFIGIRNQEDPVGAVLGAIIIIVPVFSVLGLLLRQFFKKTGLGRNMILFLDHRGVKLKEIPGLIGIMIPMSFFMLIILIYGLIIFIYFFFITIPVYLIFRFGKKKRMRDFVKWLFRLEANVCIRLKRYTRLGYVLPYFFGIMFSLILTNGHVALGVLYILILMQFTFVIALYNVIGQQEVFIQ
ncbi:MAG: hypothetical protein SCH39_05045 [Methanosarcinales archaeon]|nr:hypothetical protein [ANME-2 cluster archaeon]MDF1531111.1 hypothetical protein [ANME-2 cluster archaeon]MDW7775692.1 hypothetical protein [Methanosarcinales archaeon]